MFVLLVRYKCKPGCRDAYYDAIRKDRIDEMSRSEEAVAQRLSSIAVKSC